jgi:hypothetical protein
MTTCGVTGPQQSRCRTKNACKQYRQFVAGSGVTGNHIVNLVASMFTTYAPFAEVFAVIRQHMIAILAQP